MILVGDSLWGSHSGPFGQNAAGQCEQSLKAYKLLLFVKPFLWNFEATEILLFCLLKSLMQLIADLLFAPTNDQCAMIIQSCFGQHE